MYPPGANSCCTEDNPCDEGEGDCDSDSDCKGSLECGSNNCARWHSSASNHIGLIQTG